MGAWGWWSGSWELPASFETRNPGVIFLPRTARQIQRAVERATRRDGPPVGAIYLCMGGRVPDASRWSNDGGRFFPSSSFVFPTARFRLTVSCPLGKVTGAPGRRPGCSGRRSGFVCVGSLLLSFFFFSFSSSPFPSPLFRSRGCHTRVLSVWRVWPSLLPPLI